MVFRKRRSPASAFRNLPPYNPLTGKYAPLGPVEEITEGFEYVCNENSLYEHQWYIKARTIPAYGVFQIDETYWSNGEGGVAVNAPGSPIIGKASRWWSPSSVALPQYECTRGWFHAINDSKDVEPGATGRGFTAACKPRLVLYDQVNGFTPDIGEMWGALADDGLCKIYKGLPGFRVVGPHDNNGRVLVMRDFTNIGYAKASSSWTLSGAMPSAIFEFCTGMAAQSFSSTVYDGTDLWPNTSVTIHLPVPFDSSGNPARHPNVLAGNILPYAVTGSNGSFLNWRGACFTAMGGYSDDLVGTVKMWIGDVSDIPQGWRVYAALDTKFPLGDNSGALGSGTFGTTGTDYDYAEVRFIERFE